MNWLNIYSENALRKFNQTNTAV